MANVEIYRFAPSTYVRVARKACEEKIKSGRAFNRY